MANLRLLPLCALAGALMSSGVLVAQNAATAIAPATRILNPIDETQLVTLSGTVHPLANAQNDRGRAPDGLQLDRMHLVLKRSDAQEAALKQLVDEMHTPGSPNYHKWLTPDQFGAQFGPSDQDLATVTTWLTGHGFNVTKVNAGKQTLEISGNVAQLRSAFHTQIHTYVVNGQTHYANANNPEIPAALTPVVNGFVSLNNFPIHSYTHVLGKAQYDPVADKATPQWTIGSSSTGYSFVLAPQDFAIQYDLNPLYSAGTNGSGQTIAIVNEANINIDLVNQYRSLFGLPANPPQVIIDGNDPGVDGINNPSGPNNASVEAYLDVEEAGAVAPNATIDLVIAGDTALESGLILAAERAVYSNIAPVISVSFGNCELALGSANGFLNALWEQAAAQGITVAVSSGDAGSAGCDNDNSQAYAVYGQAVNGFSSTPYNVSVGGTDFYYSQYNGTSAALTAQLQTYWNFSPSNTTPVASLRQVIPEQPWNASQFGLNIINYYSATGSTTIAGGGGGASNAALCSSNSYSSTGICTSTVSGYPKPTWQTGTGVPSDGVRDIPDISLFASSGINASYYPICYQDGDCQSVTSGTVQISGVGGTSASTPAFAGIMALVNQKYGRQGQANTILYPLAKQYPASFHDVTAGTNSVPCNIGVTTKGQAASPNCISVTSPLTITDSTFGTATEGRIGTGTTPEYNAGAGYDLASGLGTIDANQLVTNWNKVTLAATATTMTATPANSVPLTSIPHGTSVTIAGTVTGSSPTGNVALMADNTEQSQQGQTFFSLSSGSYSGTTTNLPGGTYNIWAQYGGDTNNGMSTSGKTQITVTPETSGIFFRAISPYFTGQAGQSVSGSVDYGSQVMLSALVAPSSQLSALQNCKNNGVGCSSVNFTAPTGTVTFADNSSAINIAALNSEGDAEYSAPFAVGSHSVTAAYAGDKSYNAATATAPITFTVVKDTPVVQLAASAINTSGQTINGPGQPLVFSVLVMNGAQASSASTSAVYPAPVAAPTGTITVSGFPSGVPTSATLSAAVDPVNQGGSQSVEGVANFIVPAGTTQGTYNVTFTYSGDSNYVGGSVSYQIPIVNTTNDGFQNSTITASMSGSISPNSNIAISGTVTGTSGHAAPTGSVYIYSLGYYIGQVAISAGSGISSSFATVLNSQALPQGANQITLQYSGDTVYNPSAITLNNGNPISNPLSDFAMVPSSSNVPVTAGNSGTTTINLTSVNGFTGTVSLTCTAAAGVTCSLPASASLTSGGNASATLTVTAPSGAASGNYNVLITGKDFTGQYIHTLGMTAIVSGTSGSTPGFTLTNSGNISVTAGATSGNTSTITVTPTNGFTGTVGLSCAMTTAPSGATSPITCNIPSSVTIASAAQTATLTVNSTTSTTAGAYAVTVTGTSGSITQMSIVNVTVTAAASPTFALSNSGNISVSPGATTGNTSTITVTPSGGFTGTVSLSCSISPTASNDPATCALNPSSVSITGTTAQTSTLSIGTTAATAYNQPLKLFWPATGGGAVMAIAFFFVPRRRRNWLMMVVLLVLAASGLAIGCGGGVSGGGGGNSNPGTTAGTYTVTITGTSGSTSKMTTVTLTVL